MVLNWELQDEVRQQIERIRNADRVKLSKNEVETEIIENTRGRARARKFEFEYDEPEYMPGGCNRAPRPLEYFLAGWAFCQQVQFSRNALMAGTDLDAVRMEVSGDVDPRSELDDAGRPAGFVDDEVSMTTYIQSDAPEREIRELVRQSRADCHAHASLERKMTIEGDVVLNGESLDL